MKLNCAKDGTYDARRYKSTRAYSDTDADKASTEHTSVFIYSDASTEGTQVVKRRM